MIVMPHGRERAAHAGWLLLRVCGEGEHCEMRYHQEAGSADDAVGVR
jgi:hypothetical protein